MTGVAWAALSGVGFGLFQSMNVRAVRALDDAYVSTFLQLVVAVLVLVGVCAGTGELSRLAEADGKALTYFALGGLLHFFCGWTLLNMSQNRIGAARTAPLLSTVPVWGTLVAALTLGQLPALASLPGVALMVGGALVVSTRARLGGVRLRDSLFGVGTAVFWAISPVFTIEGLDELNAPLLGVTVGVVAATGAYGLLLATWPGSRSRARALPWRGVCLKLTAGGIAALATWGRWVALDGSTVGVVLAMSLLSVPVVLLVSPLVAGRRAEQVTRRVWLGALLVVSGSLTLLATGAA